MRYREVEIISINNIISHAYYKTYNIAYDFDITVSDKNKDLTKLLYNELVLEICNNLSRYTTRSIFYYNPVDIDHPFHKQIVSFMRKLPKILPITIFQCDIPYDLIKSKLPCIERDLDIFINKIQNKDNCNFKLDKLMKFLQANELTFLYRTYKNKIQHKMSLIR